MAKSKKNSNANDDIDRITSDVASFASSLGLASSLPSSGFNDTDFRKPAHLKPKKPEKKPKQSPKVESKKPEKNDKRNLKQKETPKPIPKPSVLSLDESNGGNSGPERFKNLPKLPLMKPSSLGVWYSDAEELEAKLIGKEAVAGARDLEEWKRIVAEKKELGERLMAQFAKDYESSRGQSGDIKMLYASMRSGTEKDKVSAFSVLVGDNPVANLRAIDALLGLVATKVGKNRAVMGFDALKELFVSSLLPDRKLKTLFQQPLKQIPENKDGHSLLLLWHWEECLKQRYERFVVALEEASKDVLPHLKDKAVKILYVLLNSKAEQERRLLTALVNKLGDPKGASASNAAHHLTRLLSQAEHPNMRAVVINEVDTFLFRPHLELRAKYHAVNFLSQIFLSNKGDGPKVAKRLIDVYFALFKVVITETSIGEQKDKTGKQKDKTGKPSDVKKASKSKPEITVDSHADWTTLLSAILTGVNRAFPYVTSSEADDIIESQTPVLFQLVHSDNFNVGIQALRLLHKITSKNQIASDRFYRALYGKLLLPASVQSSKVEMFIALLSSAMKTDGNLKRLAAFAKRLLQVALQQQPQYACGYLFLLSEILKSRPGLGQMVRQSELVDEEDEHFEDIIEENDEKKPKPAEKQVEPVENGRASTISEEVDSEDDDDIPVSLSDEEASDAEDDDDDFVVRGDSENVSESGKLSVPDNKFLKPSKRCELPGGYEPRHREPAFCNADRTGWWELTVLASHAHPSVSNWANRLLLGSDIIYSGDPVKDLSLPAFLDKFMEKKPKSSSWHGGSQIEPSKKLDMSNHLIGPEILSLADEDVPPEDLVFHKFYMNKQNSSKNPKKKKNKKKKKKQSEEDAEDLLGDDGQDDESDNEEIENLLDSVDRSISPDDAGEYDYDDLDRVAGDDDDNDLVADDDDADLPSDMGEDFDFGDDESLDGDNDDDDDDIIKIGDADDGEDADEEEEEEEQPNKRKRKAGKAGASPFASLDEYEHLFKDGDDDDGLGSDEPEEKTKRKKSSKSRKKNRKSSE